MNPQSSSDERRTYRLRVQGHIDSHWREWLGNLKLHYHEDGVTELSGHLPDQAALYGVISRLRDLGLTLLSVEQLTEKGE